MDRPAVTDAAGRIDIEMYVLVGILGFQVQELRDDEVRRVVLDRTHDENHPLLQQTRIDIVRALAACGLFYHHGDQVQ